MKREYILPDGRARASPPTLHKRPADRPIRWRWPLAALFAGLAAYGLSYLLAAMPLLADGIYDRVVGPLLVRPLSLLTGLLPLALSEVLIAAYTVWVIAAAVTAVRDVARRRRHFRNALAGGAGRVLRDVGIVLVLFYLMWGFSYAGSTFEQRAGWPAWEGTSEPELVALAEEATEAANEAYLALHGTDDLGEPTDLPDDRRAFEEALDQGWSRAADILYLPDGARVSYGRVKHPLASPLIARFGIAGVYFPFTAEANVVRGLPAMLVPHTMAHEKAHQRGTASEAEANFLAFVAAAAADDRLSRYAAAMYAQREISRRLSTPERRRLASLLLPGIQRDLRDLAAYYDRFRGVATEVGRAVNDRYLRANRVPEGVRNYGRAVRLLVTYARLHGGLLTGGDLQGSEIRP